MKNYTHFGQKNTQKSKTLTMFLQSNPLSHGPLFFPSLYLKKSWRWKNLKNMYSFYVQYLSSLSLYRFYVKNLAFYSFLERSCHEGMAVWMTPRHVESTVSVHINEKRHAFWPVSYLEPQWSEEIKRDSYTFSTGKEILLYIRLLKLNFSCTLHIAVDV